MGLTWSTLARPTGPKAPQAAIARIEPEAGLVQDAQRAHEAWVLYLRSYLLIRSAVGVIGIALPIALMIGEAFFGGSVHARGSLSAYYHSPMQDLFVGSLCVIGVLLLTYMAGQKATVDFVFSTVAGVTVLGAVFFPTNRPDIPATEPLCGPNTKPEPPSCSPIESTFGEHQVAIIHAICAILFIASLFVICLAFAHRERVDRGKPGWALVHYICAGAMALAAAWWGIGTWLSIDIFTLQPLYICEVLSVWAFAVSWFLKGDALRLLFGRQIS
jgi:hypothetical protein